MFSSFALPLVCGGEDAPEKPCSACDDAVLTAVSVSQIVRTVFVSEWTVSWMVKVHLLFFDSAMCTWSPQNEVSSLQSLWLCLWWRCSLSVQAGFPVQPNEIKPLLVFSTISVVLRVQLRSDVTCSSRNLWLLALSTSVSLMVTGCRGGLWAFRPLQYNFFGIVCVESEVILLSVDKNVVYQGSVPWLIPPPMSHRLVVSSVYLSGSPESSCRWEMTCRGLSALLHCYPLINWSGRQTGEGGWCQLDTSWCECHCHEVV